MRDAGPGQRSRFVELVDQPPTIWRIGENLPWVVPWSEEAQFRLEASQNFPGMTEIVQAERPGCGYPMPRGMNIMRQRRGVAELRCHVCGEPTPNGDRFLFPVATGAFLKVRGASRYVSHLPPTHASCAARAQRLCPHLRQAYAQPEAFPRAEGRVVPETSLPESLKFLEDRLSAGVPIAFGYYRLFGEGFTRRVQRLRRETSPHVGGGSEDDS